MNTNVQERIDALRSVLIDLPMDTEARTTWDSILHGMEGLAEGNLLDEEEVQSVIDELMDGGPEALEAQASNLIHEVLVRHL